MLGVGIYHWVGTAPAISVPKIPSPSYYPPNCQCGCVGLVGKVDGKVGTTRIIINTKIGGCGFKDYYIARSRRKDGAHKAIPNIEGNRKHPRGIIASRGVLDTGVYIGRFLNTITIPKYPLVIPII